MLHRQEVQIKDVLFERLNEMDRVDVEKGDRWQGLLHDLHSCACNAEADEGEEGQRVPSLAD